MAPLEEVTAPVEAQVSCCFFRSSPTKAKSFSSIFLLHPDAPDRNPGSQACSNLGLNGLLLTVPWTIFDDISSLFPCDSFISGSSPIIRLGDLSPGGAFSFSIPLDIACNIYCTAYLVRLPLWFSD